MTIDKSSNYKALNSPFKWAGGKSRFRQHIVPLIAKHSCYVEPFCGAAWVLFGKRPSDVEVLNDIDQELVTFFRVVKDKPEELLKSFEWELVARAEFERLAQLDPHELTDVQRAHRFYYLIMAGWGGESGYPRFQTSISDGGHGNRLIGALKHLEKRILPIHQRLRTAIIENLSWEACIDRYDSAKTFFYVDPPYPGNGVNYKHNMRDWKDHQLLADRLTRSESKWILSSYDIPEVRAMYAHCYIIPVRTYSGMKAGSESPEERVVNEEVLVANYPLPTQAELTTSTLDTHRLQLGLTPGHP
jgi:DNA adenine methylase